MWKFVALFCFCSILKEFLSQSRASCPRKSSLQTWTRSSHSFTPRVENCEHKRSQINGFHKPLGHLRRMEATVLDQGRKTSKKCQIEGCLEITVGSRTALCRKHRNNKYKQNYNKKRKRKALGPDVSMACRSFSVSMVKCAILVGNFNFDNKAYFFVKLEGVTLYRSHMSLSSTFQFCYTYCFISCKHFCPFILKAAFNRFHFLTLLWID